MRTIKEIYERRSIENLFSARRAQQRIMGLNIDSYCGQNETLDFVLM